MKEGKERKRWTEGRKGKARMDGRKEGRKERKVGKEERGKGRAGQKE
jgi:hypothetical protein